MPDLFDPALTRRLRGAARALVIGVGGGFDVYAGVPVAERLRSEGTELVWANRTFTAVQDTDELEGCDATRRDAEAPLLHHLVHDATDWRAHVYFPEWHLAAWLAERGHRDRIALLGRGGYAPTRTALDRLLALAEPDLVVAVDGGTDSLLRGDESGLGTPLEDLVTMVALHDAWRAHTDGDGDRRPPVLLSVGAGVDAFHGVAHAEVLARLADLTRAGALLGVLHLTQEQPEVRAWLDLVERVCTLPGHESIVQTSIAGAVVGRFGDHHSTQRTRGSELFLNPLMASVWGVELRAVVEACGYAEALRRTTTFTEAGAAIHAYRRSVTPPPVPRLPM